ncbi:hypothetical protein [Vibrio phage vB_pir03]|nr:hypothetical protein [Vibrio phage vB_pir03]
MSDIDTPQAKGFEYEDILNWAFDLVEAIDRKRCELYQARRLNSPDSEEVEPAVCKANKPLDK